MSLIAEVRFTSPELPLSNALAAVPGMELTVEQAIADDPEVPILFLWAAGDDFETFEAALTDDETVGSTELVENAGEKRLYRVQISPEAAVVLYPVDVELGASRLAVTATSRSLDARIRFPDRETLRQYRERCAERGVSLSLQRLYQSRESSTGAAYGLTPKQRRAVVHAAEKGYFEVPRGRTLAELAADLEISRQSASERIRRGVDALVKSTLSTEERTGMFEG